MAHYEVFFSRGAVATIALWKSAPVDLSLLPAHPARQWLRVSVCVVWCGCSMYVWLPFISMLTTEPSLRSRWTSSTNHVFTSLSVIGWRHGTCCPSVKLIAVNLCWQVHQPDIISVHHMTVSPYLCSLLRLPLSMPLCVVSVCLWLNDARVIGLVTYFWVTWPTASMTRTLWSHTGNWIYKQFDLSNAMWDVWCIDLSISV